MSAILIEALTPDPIPVRGSDEKFHAAYELAVLNFSPRPATITEVEILAPDGAVLGTLFEQEVGARTMIVADYAPAQPSAGRRHQHSSGKTALLVLEVTADDRAQLPESFSHRISASYGAAETGGGKIAELWPDTATQKVWRGEDLAGGARGDRLTAERVGVARLGGVPTLNVHRSVLLPWAGGSTAGSATRPRPQPGRRCQHPRERLHPRSGRPR